MTRARLALVLCLVAPAAFAHEPLADGGIGDPEEDNGVLPPAVEPPVLLQHEEPIYPRQAFLDRREAHVHLELLIDDTGHVQNVKVIESGGPDFDAALLDVVKRYVFRPALQNGQPARALVRYTHVFRVAEAVVPELVDAGEPVDAGAPPVLTPKSDFSTVVLAHRPISAASSFSVRDRDFALRPIGSVQDILRVTPGLVTVQHSGGGKASQYFLRGFDADHGTDLALNVDGVPVNMPTHAHGQGFADTNFIIPEVVERVEITKGPYFANQGDFATAGAVNMVSRTEFDHGGFSLGFGGSPGHGAPSGRALIFASPELGSVNATFAAELGRQNGPFDNPENWDKYKLFNRLTFSPTPQMTLSLIEMSYGGDWHGSGQIPARAVDQGLVGTFGSVDPDEGGATSRHQLALTFSLRPDERSELKLLAYVGAYDFNLYSNFTLYLEDPEHGDEIEQVDHRTFAGAKASYRAVRNLGPVRFDTMVGADVRYDSIHNELWHTEHRVQLANRRNDDVTETLAGVYLNEEITPFRWLRLDVGGRADMISFQVGDHANVAQSGAAGAYQLSPKLSLIASPLELEKATLDVYLNYGHGFHSNDVRGAFATPAVTPLTRAIGYELGTRARLFNRWDLGAALWRLDLANETVWDGDNGTTSVSAPTLRYGVELETRFEVTSWLAADLDVTFSHSQFSADGSNGGGLALAPKATWSGGLSARHPLGPGTLRGGLRFYGIGDRPANDDGSLTAPGFTQVDLHLGYRHRWFDIAFDIENLLNAQFRSAQFATVSRLRNEPAIGSQIPTGFSCGTGRLAPGAMSGRFYGCEDVDYTPAYPFTARVTATVYFD
jgi:TonB family protein